MPVYDVGCKKCGAVQEVLCPMEERNRQKCATCGGQTKVLIQSFGRPERFTPRIVEEDDGTVRRFDNKKEYLDWVHARGEIDLHFESPLKSQQHQPNSRAVIEQKVSQCLKEALREIKSIEVRA